MQEAGDVMKTLLGQSSPEHQEIFEYLQENEDWLSTQEVEAYKFLAKEFDDSGQYSTETRFIEKFEIYDIPMQKSRVLNMEDLEVASKVLINERKRIYVGGQLVKYGSIISREGFSEEIAEKIAELWEIMAKDLEIDFTTASDILKWYLERKEKPQGLQTFIDPIDANIGGLKEGTVTTIFGYTGHFKSTFALNLLYNNVYHLGYNVAFISLEMTKKDIEFNLTSRHSYTYAHEHGGNALPAKRIRESSLSDEEQEFLETVSEHRVENQRGSYFILDEEDFRGLSFAEITEKLHALNKKMKGGLDAVIVDHMNLLKFGATKDPYETINDYVSYFRKLALNFYKDEKLAVIMLAQANREGWKRARANDGAYEMTSIAEANEMERSSSFVISVYSSEAMRVGKEIGVQLLKNRYGETIETPYIAFVDPRYYLIGNTPNDDFTKPFDIGANVHSFDPYFTMSSIDVQDLYKLAEEV